MNGSITYKNQERDFIMVLNVTVTIANTGVDSPKSKDYNVTITRKQSEITANFQPGYFLRLDSNAAYLSKVEVVSFEYIN